MPDFYGEDLAAIHAAGFTDLARAAAEELTARLQARSRVVEFGCGDGTTARMLCDAGHSVHGFDISEAMIQRAMQQEPRATFEIGSSADAPIPACDVIVAIGEVFGYVPSETLHPLALGALFERCHAALDRGGLLMFDLAGPGRAEAREQRGWTAGEGWIVLVESRADSKVLVREIVTLRRSGDSRYVRSDETHRLRLHRRSDVLAELHRHGFTARVLRDGYAGAAMPSGLVAYLAKRK